MGGERERGVHILLAHFMKSEFADFMSYRILEMGIAQNALNILGQNLPISRIAHFVN